MAQFLAKRQWYKILNQKQTEHIQNIFSFYAFFKKLHPRLHTPSGEKLEVFHQMTNPGCAFSYKNKL